MTSLSVALLLSAAAQQSVPPPPPPIIHHPAPGSRERTLVTWMPGEVRCAGGMVRGASVRRPLNMLSWSGMRSPAPATYDFAIDSRGRPVSIARRSDAAGEHSADFAPAIAASLFPAQAREECSVSFTATARPLDTAAREELISYTMAPTSGRLPDAAWARIAGTGTCDVRPRAQVLMRAFPDFSRVPSTPGVRDWVAVHYDTDARGRPRGARMLSSTGNAALDAAAVQAVRDSRFAADARTACVYTYWRAPATLAAPSPPTAESLRPADATCPTSIAWQTRGASHYPDAFLRRGVEGWAIVAFDVAPWGEPGNVRVLAAQPAEDFGRQARQLIAASRMAASGSGLTGCVERVRYAMPADGMQRPEPDMTIARAD